jgi:hypothetical protein
MIASYAAAQPSKTAMEFENMTMINMTAINIDGDDFYTMFNITDTQFDNYIIIMHKVLVTLGAFYFVFIRQSEIISPPAVIIYDISAAIWQFNKLTCDALDLSNRTITSDQIFYELIIQTMYILLGSYAMYNKKYAALLWIMIPTTFEIMKGFACGIEKVLSQN